MTATIPDSHLDLLTEKAAFAQLATVMQDGTPQVTPVWIGWDGTHILVNTEKKRVKARNIMARPAVALGIVDPGNPYRYIGIRGKVVASDETMAAAHIDLLAKKYMGVEKYPYNRPGDVRIVFKIEPTRVHAYG